MDITFFNRITFTPIKSFCCIVFLALFSSQAVAYPNTGTIMNYSAGTAGTWNLTQSGVCTACHGDNGSTGTTFTSFNTPIAPSTSEYFNLNITSGPLTPKRGGFNLKVVNSSGTTTGTLYESDSNAVMDGDVARHTNSTDNSWSLRWLSPSFATNVRFSYCTNSINNNGGSDGDNIDCGYRSMVVNAPPVAVDDVFSVTQNHSGSGYFYPITHGAINDSDTESSEASLTLTYNSSSISGASLSCSTSTERCTISLNNNYDYLDSGESVTLSGYRDYVLHDGTWTSSNTRELADRTGRMRVRVTGLNDAPTTNNDSGYTIDEGATSTNQITVASLLSNDNDVDNSDSLTLSNLSCATNCSSVSRSGNYIIFTHDGSETTPATFTYRVHDNTAFSNYSTVTININPVNDAPTADDDSGYTINEGATSTTQISLASILMGDIDNEGNSLTVTSLLCWTNCSSVTKNSSYILFTHDGSETTTSSFRYRVYDGAAFSNYAYVTVDITPQNDAPIANPDSGYAAINEGMGSGNKISLVNLLSNDTDAELDSLSVTNLVCGSNCLSVMISGNGTYAVFRHDGSETTTASFTYKAFDGVAYSNAATVSLDITPVNDKPTVVDDSGYTIIEGAISTTEISIVSLLANDNDNDGDTLSVTSLACVSNCSSVSANSSYILFTHDGSETTTSSFQYKAYDGTAPSDFAYVTVTITPQNDPPVADADSGFTAFDEGATSTTQIAISDLLSGDTDAEGDSLTVANLSCASNCSTVSSNSTYVLFQHDGSETTSATFSYTAFDGTDNSDPALVTLSITAINDTPTATNDSGYTINEGDTSSTQISIASLLLNDNDNEGDTLSITNLLCVRNCSSVSKNATHILFTHDNSETATASFTYTANDGTIDSNVATVSLNITAQNDAPIANNNSGYTINEGATSTNQISIASLIANDTDKEGDSLSVTNLVCGNNCSSVLNDGTYILFTHDGSETTTANFTYKVNDGTIDSDLPAIVTLSIVAQNDAPIADPDSGFSAIDEGATSTTQIAISDLLSGDTDAEGDSLSVTNLSCSSNCSSVSANSTYVFFQHDASETTTASFTYTANDGNIDSNVATVSLTITAINDAPTASNDSGYTIIEGASSTTEISLASLISNDNDNEGDTLSVTNLVCVSNCSSVSKNATHILFTHDNSETTTASFTYTVNDGTIDSNAATVSLNITPQNDTPIISVTANDFTQGAIGNSVNDVAAVYTISDSEAGVLAVAFTTGTNTNNHYTLDTLNQQVKITATALTEINSGRPLDVINLTVTDVGALTANSSDTPGVFVSTNPPTFNESAQSVNVNEDNSINVTYSAADDDSDVSLIEWTVDTNASNGSVVITGGSTGSSAVFRYTPNLNFTGADSFVARASSSGSDITITTTINVVAQNDAPVADNDSGYTINEGATSSTEITLASLLSGDNDVDGDSISVTNLICVSNCSSVSANASHVLFTHDGSETTTASFTYTANDGTIDSNIATVSLIISPQNDAPIADVHGSYTINEGATTTTEISLADLLSGDTDAEGDSLSVTNLACVSNCTSVNTVSTYIIFVHDGSETTSASFTYTANDGVLDSNAVIVNMVITPVNDAPVADNDSGYSVTEGETSTSEISIASLLAGDSDAEGDTLSVTNLLCVSNCTSVTTNTNATHVLFEHDGTETSTGSFSYKANDGTVDSNTATVSINIAANNDAPIANNDSGFTINEGATSSTEIPLSSLLLGDTDVEGDTLTVTNLICVSNCSSVTANATHVLFTHDGSETTTASFTYTANDGTIDSNIATVSLIISPQNDAPIADVHGSYTINEGATTTTEISLADLLSGDTDAEGDSLSVTNLACVSNCSNVSIISTYIIFVHDGSETNSASFSYTANDGSLDSNVATINMLITPINDVPVADNDSGYSIDEGSSSSTEIALASLLAGDTDAEGDTLSVTNLQCVSNCSSVSANATHVLFRHDGTETSTGSFSYKANDGTVDSNTATVSINITPKNDAPIANNDSGYTINEGATSNTEITLASLLSGDTDAEGDTLTVTNLQCVSNCSSVTTNATHVLFTHDGSETTTASFTYTANDGTVNSNIAMVSLIIIPQNDAPIALNDMGYSLNEGATSSTEISLVSLVTNDSDAENDSLSVTNLSCASHCVSISDNGIYIILEHDGSEVNAATFTYTSNDGSIDSNTATVTVTINPTNDAPIIKLNANTLGNNTSVTMDEDSSPNAFSLTLSVTDAENDVINWSITSSASNGTASVTGSGNSKAISYSPNANFNGTDTFVVQASDALLTDTVTVTVTVNEINDAPVIAQIPTQTILEGETISITAVVEDVDSADINDGAGSLSWAISSGNDGNMSISNTGVFAWTAPKTGIFNNVIGPITLSVSDGLENGSSAATTSFNISVSPADDDNDGIANDEDYCPTIADSSNADNDGDGTKGVDSDEFDVKGGDACDTDDDNDGLSDDFEDKNFLDSKDASDADKDFDGDGISNIDEFLAGTSIFLATINIDATGYLTAYQLVAPDPTLINAAATLVFADNYGPFRPGTHKIKWTASASDVSSLNLGSEEQILNVHPVVSLSADQQTAEGATAKIKASINGQAVTYPVIINYSVSGTSDSSDHDAQDGVMIIAQGDFETSFDINVFQDTITEGDETIIITATDISNAVKGLQDSHTATIKEGNVQPIISMAFSQNGVPINTAYIGDGEITLALSISDPNTTQSQSINWQGSADILNAPSDQVTQTWTYTPTISGYYKIQVSVTDNGSPSMSNSLSSFLNVSNTTAPVLTAIDTDGDGIDDATEGYNDTDMDGIPDYLDNLALSNLQIDQSISEELSLVLETKSGLSLNIGNIARASNALGTVITDSEIHSFGSFSAKGNNNSVDSFDHIGGIYDFFIDGLIPRSTAYLVIPLQIAIPKNAIYRQYSEAQGWTPFIINSRNKVSSYMGDNRTCPTPESNQFNNGLNYLSTCIQLAIEDGGPNDQDGLVNGRVTNTGSVSILIAEKGNNEIIVEQGGKIPFWFILALSLLFLRRVVLKFNR